MTCFTEHHLRNTEIGLVNLDKFVLESLSTPTPLPPSQISKTKNEWLLTFQIYRHWARLWTLCILSITRKHQTDYPDHQQATLLFSYINYSYYHKKFKKYMSCRDININFLTDRCKKYELEAVSTTYNLKPSVTFPTHYQISIGTAIDVFFYSS